MSFRPHIQPAGAWVTAIDLAVLLDFSPRWVREMMASGLWGPVARIPGAMQVSEDRVRAWLAAARYRPALVFAAPPSLLGRYYAPRSLVLRHGQCARTWQRRIRSGCLAAGTIFASGEYRVPESTLTTYLESVR